MMVRMASARLKAQNEEEAALLAVLPEVIVLRLLCDSLQGSPDYNWLVDIDQKIQEKKDELAALEVLEENRE